MYIQRYMPHLPAAGEVVIFDRSWYNRAGVERVMGFCTEEQVAALPGRGAAASRRRSSTPGVILLKYWLEVSPEEQTRRLEARIRRRAQDLEALAHGPQVLQPLVRLLARARRDVRQRPTPPGRRGTWRDSDDKKRARLNIIRHLLASIPYKEAPREKIKLPKRQKPAGYREPKYPFKFVPEAY